MQPGPDLLFLIQSKCLYILELTVGFESNLNVNNNAVRKKEKYLNLIKEMSRNYRCVRFVNLSMSSLGVFSDECSTFLDMMNDINIDKKQQRYIIKKMINIAIRATYYIFCCRNRSWDSPDLMQFCYFFLFLAFVLFCFCFCFLFLFFFFVFLIIQSQAAFVNCLYVARFTIVHSKTQIKFPFGYYISSSSSPSLSLLLLLLLFNYHPSNYYPSLKNLHSST